MSFATTLLGFLKEKAMLVKNVSDEMQMSKLHFWVPPFWISNEALSDHKPWIKDAKPV